MASTPPKRRVIPVGPGQVVTETFKQDVVGFGRADIARMIRRITVEQTQIEIDHGNPPMVVEVDGSKSKPVSMAEKKVIVLFNTVVQLAALERLKTMLLANIANSTEAVSGALRSPGNWEFKLIRNGRALALPSTAVPLGQNDFIVLRPRLPYASAVNKRVAHGRGSFTYRPENAKAGSKVAKRNQKLGFLAMTARQARGVGELVQFTVVVRNTIAFQVPGEKRRYGTAFLLITPRRKRNYRR